MYYLRDPKLVRLERNMIVFKKVRGRHSSSRAVAMLRIPKGVQAILGEYKCRAERAVVLEIVSLGRARRRQNIQRGYSIWQSGFIYRVGELVECDRFDPNPIYECGGGIHFFRSIEHAFHFDM